MAFFLEALLGGLMAGMLYSLVALGFVLIYKASGVFNFAQGAMVLFAALAMARFSEWIPQWLGLDNKFLGNLIAFILAGACMFVLAWLIERLVLRHLVNQEGVTLLMATLGITYFLDGLGQTIFGSAIYQIDVGMPKEPVFLFENVFEGGVLISLEDVYAACIAALLVAVLSLFFQKTGTGRALRAVADDHQAAQSIGIPLNRIWVIVWFVAGITALVAVDTIVFMRFTIKTFYQLSQTNSLSFNFFFNFVEKIFSKSVFFFLSHSIIFAVKRFTVNLKPKSDTTICLNNFIFVFHFFYLNFGVR